MTPFQLQPTDFITLSSLIEVISFLNTIIYSATAAVHKTCLLYTSYFTLPDVEINIIDLIKITENLKISK